MSITYRIFIVFDIRSTIRECLSGKIQAQKAMYDYLAPKIYPVCLRYAGNAFDAEDIMQEGFIKLFGALAQFQFNGSFDGWARRIFVNTALERFRSRFYMYTVVNSSHETYDHYADDYDVSEDISAGEILEYVAGLSPQYRLVFNLYAIEGYSHKEIAEKLQISEGTSKSNLARARGILQQRISQITEPVKQVV